MNAAQQAKLRVEALQKLKQSQNGKNDQNNNKDGGKNNSNNQRLSTSSSRAGSFQGNNTLAGNSSKFAGSQDENTQGTGKRNSVKAIMEQIKETRLKRQMEKEKKKQE